MISEYNCSDAFISVSDKGRLGNNICQFFTLYLFKFEFGIRVRILVMQFFSLGMGRLKVCKKVMS